MKRSCSSAKRSALLMAAVAVLSTGCARPPSASTGVFVDTRALQDRLVRGSSTRLDVQGVLGTPTGMGGALLPAVPQTDEVWLYQDLEVGGYRKDEGHQGVIRADLRQQVLLVFFNKEGRYDGFMWYSTRPKESGQ